MPAAPALAPRTRELTFVSWNVHGCAGRRGLDPHAAAAVLLANGADIAALQECGTDERGREHAEAIAHSLGFGHVAFGVNLERGLWRYGNALISRYPLTRAANVPLPFAEDAEPRGCVLARVDLGDDASLLAGSAHFGLGAVERVEQAEALVREARIASAESILLGMDGNDWFPGPDTRTLRAHFEDAWRSNGSGPRATYPARFPVLRLDHVYSRGDLHILRCEHSDAAHARSVSDHVPVRVRARVAYSAACSSDRSSSQAGSSSPAC